MRTGHANLNIILRSTGGYPPSGDIIKDVETNIWHHPHASGLHDADYESDPDHTGHRLDAHPAHESDI